MFSHFVANTKGALASLAVIAYTLLMMIPLTLLAAGKLLSPTRRIRDSFRKQMVRVVETWISLNNSVISLYRGTRWDIDVPGEVHRKGGYLVACNHQTWIDILALQKCFNRRLPMLSFFIKRQLIYLPVLGFAWWALDFPFMRRHSREEIRKNPKLVGKDLETARIACDKLREFPFAMMSFPEGTRFSPEKRDETGSPYRNLLKPKVGGIGVVLYALGDRLQSMMDVTIVYPGSFEGKSAPSFWDLLTGKVPEIIIKVRELEIPKHLLGRNFRTDRNIRNELENWIKQVWREKDELIAGLTAP
jgi:1-acyl-sn-glycerol-3-phosphate acyltransferase